MAYGHGVYVEEKATGLVTPVEVDSALPVIVGTAPVHNLPEGSPPPVNEPMLIYSMPEFVAAFGTPGDGESTEDFTLYQAADSIFTRYGVGPIVFINVFDPARHTRILPPKDDGEEARNVPDVSKVTAEDIIGGVDASTLRRTGLKLVEEVFPRFRLVPGQILAPRFCREPSVALAIGAACAKIAGHFRAIGIIEVPDSVGKYTDAPAWLNDNNLTDCNLLCMLGDLVYGNTVEPGSIHLAGVIASRDAENEGVPFWSPSNKRFQAQGLTHAGRKLHLTPVEAAYLNGNGIVTGLNMIGGLVAWGDQTAAYPGVTDVKDSSIPIRRMFSWIGNTLVLTNWQHVSTPSRRRLVETVQDSFNVWLNGLAGREMILGGRVTFEMVDNPDSDIVDGKVRWHVYVTPSQAARELFFILEYDPSYFKTLFGVFA